MPIVSSSAPLPQAVRATIQYLKDYGYQIIVGLLLTSLFALHAARIFEIPLISQLENMAYDVRLRLTMPEDVDHRIVIVDIDEKSLAAEGRWPWSRSRIATLVDNLFEHYGARSVGFDIVFAEPERLGQIEDLVASARAEGRDDVLGFVERLGKHPDEKFADSLAGRDAVLGYYFSHGGGKGGAAGMLPEPLLPAEIAEFLGVPAVHANGFGANLPILQNAARAGGFFDNPLNDEDGVFRRIPLVQEYEGALYTSLALAMAEVSLGEPVQFSEANDAVLVGSHRVPVDQDMAALIPFRGPQGSYPYVSATDVLSMNAPADVLKNALVLVGTTAPGLFDLRNTPVQKIYPGVEIHANVLSGVLDDRFLSRPDFTLALNMFQIIVIGALLSFILPAAGPNRGTVLTLLFLAGVIVLNIYLWVYQASVVPLSAALLLIALHYVYVTSYGFITESRNKKAIVVQFGRYVPEEIVDEMSRNPENYSLEGEKRELTVLFTDVRNFTTISESMDPHELTRMMNSFLTPLTRAVHQSKGTIDKYMGDAMMAFWGAPLPDPQHASRAVGAALEMIGIIDSLQESFRAEGWAEIRVGIGLNTGEMSVGNMGSEFRVAYTVMGDAVNLGSRLEGLTKQYGVSIIVSEFTADAAPDFAYAALDLVRVKGKLEPVTILTPLGPRADIDGEWVEFLSGHHAALDHYRERRFEEALEWFSTPPKIAALEPLYGIYRERIGVFLETPPGDDFDGVFEFKTK